MPRDRCTKVSIISSVFFSIKYYVYFMNENDKDWLLYVRSQYLQKFELSWWPFLHEYLPGLPKLVPLVILEAIKNKSFRYILTCIQVSALKIITLLFCQGNVSVKLFWLWTDLSTYTFIPRALSLMWRLCHFNRASNVEIGVECWIFVILFNRCQVLQFEAPSRY